MSKQLGKHLLDWAYILVLVSFVNLPLQHLRTCAPEFFYWGAWVIIGLIAQVTKVVLRPDPLILILSRKPCQWRALLAAGTLYMVFFAVSAQLALHIRYGHQPVLFIWTWPATVALVLVAAIISWIAFRRDPALPLPPPDVDYLTAAQGTAMSITGKRRSIWTMIGPLALVPGVIVCLNQMRMRDGQVESSIEIVALIAMFWLAVLTANLILANDNVIRDLTWGTLPFVYWCLVFQLAGVLPPASKESVLMVLMIMSVLMMMAGTYIFWRKRRHFLFLYYLLLAFSLTGLLTIGWSDFAPLW